MYNIDLAKDATSSFCQWKEETSIDVPCHYKDKLSNTGLKEPQTLGTQLRKQS